MIKKEMELPSDKINDLVVVKKIEDLAEARRVYQKFADSVTKDTKLSISCELHLSDKFYTMNH